MDINPPKYALVFLFLIFKEHCFDLNREFYLFVVLDLKSLAHFKNIHYQTMSKKTNISIWTFNCTHVLDSTVKITASFILTPTFI